MSKVLEYQAGVLSSSTIKGTILGGSGSSAAGSIEGLEALEKYITAGGNYSSSPTPTRRRRT